MKQISVIRKFLFVTYTVSDLGILSLGFGGKDDILKLPLSLLCLQYQRKCLTMLYDPEYNSARQAGVQ